MNGTKQTWILHAGTDQTFLLAAAVFQMKPVLPSEMDKRACGWTNIISGPPCRTGLLSWVCQFFNFSNRTIIKGDNGTFVNQSQNPVFTDVFIWMNFIAIMCAAHFLCGRQHLKVARYMGGWQFWRVWNTDFLWLSLRSSGIMYVYKVLLDSTHHTIRSQQRILH